MKRKIATLDVYVDSDESAFSFTRKTESGKYETVMATNDSHAKENGHNGIHDIETFRTVFAHELGHFVAVVTKDESHNPINQYLFRLTNDRSTLVAGEKRAWEFAHLIYPNLNREDERFALKSYNTTPDTTKWRFQTFEPIPSGLPMPCPKLDEAKLDRLRAMYWKAERAKLDRKAHVWEWSVLGTIFALYWIAGLLTLGGVR